MFLCDVSVRVTNWVGSWLETYSQGRWQGREEGTALKRAKSSRSLLLALKNYRKMMTGVVRSEESWITFSTHSPWTLMVKSRILLNFRGLPEVFDCHTELGEGGDRSDVHLESFLAKWFSFLKAQGMIGVRHVHPQWQEWTTKAANRCSNHGWRCFCNGPLKQKRFFSIGGQSFQRFWGYPNSTDSSQLQQNEPISSFIFTERHLLLLITKVIPVQD